MKKLVLHSDQINGKTQVDEISLRLFNNPHPKIAYIPSQSDLTRKYFNQKVEWYKQFGITDLFYFDLDQEYSEEKIPELLSCDGIFLSGGNTYYFLNSLKKRNFISTLTNYVSSGGVLIGVSAGSILMSKTIAITSVDDDLGGDQNTVGLRDFSALGLIDFEFFPHYDPSNTIINDRLKEYSKVNKSVIYTCQNEGDGIIVEDDNVQFLGNILKIEDGNISIQQ